MQSTRAAAYPPPPKTIPVSAITGWLRTSCVLPAGRGRAGGENRCAGALKGKGKGNLRTAGRRVVAEGSGLADEKNSARHVEPGLPAGQGRLPVALPTAPPRPCSFRQWQYVHWQHGARLSMGQPLNPPRMPTAFLAAWNSFCCASSLFRWWVGSARTVPQLPMARGWQHMVSARVPPSPALSPDDLRRLRGPCADSTRARMAQGAAAHWFLGPANMSRKLMVARASSGPGKGVGVGLGFDGI